MLFSLGLIALGLILLIAGGEILLRGAVGLATLLAMTPAVIGLTVVAAGTSVPELAVSMIAASQNSADIAVGNVVGSNIFNIAFILGLSAMLRPLVISGNTIKLEYPVMALVTRTFRWEGFGSVEDVANHIVGAIFMGFGGVTALGCTIGQGLTGISTLALGSILTLAAIIVGSVAAVKYQMWRIERMG